MKDLTTKPAETKMFGFARLGLVILLTLRCVWGAP